MPILFDGPLFADYHQVYLSDASLPDLPEEWDAARLAQRINLAQGVLVISTARNAKVPVRVELHPHRPTIDVAAYDHAVEANLSLPSGQMVVAGLTDHVQAAARVAVPASNYRVLVTFSGLGSIAPDGLAGGDRYVAHLWPTEASSGVAVLKQYAK